MAELLAPVVSEYCASRPMAELLAPVVSERCALIPMAELFVPVVRERCASNPTATLDSDAVDARNWTDAVPAESLSTITGDNEPSVTSFNVTLSMAPLKSDVGVMTRLTEPVVSATNVRVKVAVNAVAVPDPITDTAPSETAIDPAVLPVMVIPI